MYEINKNEESFYEIKGSKFISYIYNVKNIDEIKEIIKEKEKLYSDATHITYAYNVNGIKKKSDDNEPSGTAGMPILNVIDKNYLTNVLIIVIRYFGGIKLGAGGLVRAYTKAATDVLNKVEKHELKERYQIEIKTNYKELDKVLYLLKDKEIKKEFNEAIIIKAILTKEEIKELDNNNINYTKKDL